MAKTITKGKPEKTGRLYSLDDLPIERDSKLYFPSLDEKYHTGFREKLKQLWSNNAYTPKTIAQYATATVFPGPYLLWKMPKETHASLTKALESATKLAAVVPDGQPLALATGIAAAISTAIYGLKTKSGKHFIAGLQGVATLAKKSDTSKLPKAHRENLENAVTHSYSVLDHISESVAA